MNSAAIPRKRSVGGWRRHDWLLCCLVVVAAGCSSGRAPEALELPPQSNLPSASNEAPSPSEPEAQAQASPAPPARPVGAARGDDPTVVLIDPGGKGPTTPQDVVAAARAEKERRKASGPPVAVISNKNLSEMGKGGRLTTGKAEATKAAATVAAVPAQQQEAYWRDRVRSLRERWKRAAESIAPLQEQIAKLRTEFYSLDDPFRRDTEVKPAWDLALEKLDRAKREVRQAQEQLTDALEEGRRSGALPGWLREGAELEPPQPATGEPETFGEPRTGAEPREPQVLDENDPPR